MSRLTLFAVDEFFSISGLELKLMMRKMLEALKPIERRLVNLVFFKGFTRDEAIETMEIIGVEFDRVAKSAIEKLRRQMFERIREAEAEVS